jgi:hypothetical protein
VGQPRGPLRPEITAIVSFDVHCYLRFVRAAPLFLHDNFSQAPQIYIVLYNEPSWTALAGSESAAFGPCTAARIAPVSGLYFQGKTLRCSKTFGYKCVVFSSTVRISSRLAQSRLCLKAAGKGSGAGRSAATTWCRFPLPLALTA